MFRVIMSDSWYGTREIYRGDFDACRLRVKYWRSQGADCMMFPA